MLNSVNIHKKYNDTPHEIHLTVDNINNIDSFKQICENINVKPILLDLYTNTKNLNHLMTSSVIRGTSLFEIFNYCNTIKKTLTENGFNVIRTKVEIPPTHELVDIYNKNNITYFENHTQLIISPCEFNCLYDFCKKYLKNVHLSSNYFKKHNDKFTIMLTYRNYTSDYLEFLSYIKNYQDILKQNNYKIYDKLIVEFCIYDSNVSCDYEWMLNNGV